MVLVLVDHALGHYGDPAPGRSGKERGQVGQGSDEGVLPRGGGELDRRLDLGSHRAGSKVDPGERVRVGEGDGALLRGPPAGVDRIGVGGDHQEVGMKVPGQDGAGPVLVDDGLDADERSSAGLVHGGYAAAAGTDDHGSAGHQSLDGALLEDPLRHR